MGTIREWWQYTVNCPARDLAAAKGGYARPTTGPKGSRRVAVLVAVAAAGAAFAPFRDGQLDQAVRVAGPAPLPGYAFERAPDLVSALIPTDQIADGGDRELEGASGIAIFRMGERTYAAVAAGTDNGVQIPQYVDGGLRATVNTTDDADTAPTGPRDTATFRIGGSTCAAVASPGANGIQMLRIPAVRPVPDHAFVTARKTAAANHAGRDVPANNPPADQTVGEDQTVTISGTASNDGDTPTCRRASEQSALPVSGSDTLSRSFTAPQVDIDTATAFTPAADDGRGASSSCTVSATIPAGPPPTATAATPAWDDPNDGTVIGYKILSRAAPTGPDLAVPVSDAGSADASCAVRNPEPDAICVFGAVATNGHGEPAHPNFVRLSTLPEGELCGLF